MGIQNLYQFIKRYASDAVRYCTIVEYKDKVVGIDGNCFLYKFKSFSGNKPDEIVGSFMCLIEYIMQVNAIPVVIFDGKSPIEKEHTANNRKKRYAKSVELLKQFEDALLESHRHADKKMKVVASPPHDATETCGNAGEAAAAIETPEERTGKTSGVDVGSKPVAAPTSSTTASDKEEKDVVEDTVKPIEDTKDSTDPTGAPESTEVADSASIDSIQLTQSEKIKHSKLKRQCLSVSSEEIARLVDALKARGVIAHIAEEEADFLLVRLARKRVISAVVSEDADFLVNLPPHVDLVRNMGKHYCSPALLSCYNRKEILNILKFSNDQFVDLCILLGCDYLSRVKGCGIVTAHDHIKMYHSIEKLYEQNYTFRQRAPKNYLDLVKRARNLFANPRVAPGSCELLQLQVEQFDRSAFLEGLNAELGSE